MFVSESSVYRVLEAEGLTIPSRPSREPVGARTPWPDWIEFRPNQVWGHDFSCFARARSDALAVLDLVSRYWIGFLLAPAGQGVSEHIAAVSTQALEAQGLLAEAEARMVAPNTDEQLPILLAVSDNGPQMVSGTTREFMALHSLAMHTSTGTICAARARARTGRPHTPTDQAHIESFFGHLKHDWPHLEHISDPAVLADELERVRTDYNTVRLHAGLGYVTPDDEHHGRGEDIRHARREGMTAARQARIAYRRQDQDRTR